MRERKSVCVCYESIAHPPSFVTSIFPHFVRTSWLKMWTVMRPGDGAGAVERVGGGVVVVVVGRADDASPLPTRLHVRARL